MFTLPFLNPTFPKNPHTWQLQGLFCKPTLLSLGGGAKDFMILKFESLRENLLGEVVRQEYCLSNNPNWYMGNFIFWESFV
jgi:hypothetical protein